MNTKIEEFWNRFLESGRAPMETMTCSYEVAQYGGTKESKSALASLIYSGMKTGTSSLISVYGYYSIKMPEVGECTIVLDGNEEPRCIVRTTAITITPFNRVTVEHARREGEGDGSLEAWRKGHEIFFRNECRKMNKEFSPDAHVVCEQFVLMYKE